MCADFVSVESMIAARDAADWAFWTMIATWVTAIVTLVAVFIAWRGIHTWKEQQISVAKADWIASLANYASGLSHLPDQIHWKVPEDKVHIEKIADLMYESIKCWKVLQEYLEMNKRLNKKFMKKYKSGWEEFATKQHNGYMEARVCKDDLKAHCINLYNL
ncbi:hypothetical protein RGJ01_001205 [Serratia marcescens]